MIKQIYKIKISVKKVWAALVQSKHIAAWSGSLAKMSAKKGARFSLWGGEIFGKNILVEPEKKLVQEWYGGKWKKPSIVEISLSEHKGVTEIKLIHKDVPPKEVKEFASGWKDYYFGPIKKYLEEE